jgi:hypothetical protein
MAQPVLVGTTSATANATTLTITRTTALGNCLLVGIALADGTDSVASVTDNLGNNAFGSQINQWECLATGTLGGDRIELWACLRALAISHITIQMTSGGDETQFVTGMLAEYTNVTGISTYGGLQVNANQNTPTTYNTGHSQKYENQHTQINVTIEQPPTTATSVIVGFFSMVLSALPSDTQAFGIATSGTKQVDLNESSPYPNLALLDNPTAGVDGNLSIGVNQNQYIEGGDPNDYNYFAASTLQGLYVVLTDSLVLTHEPGFSDVSLANFAANGPARGFDLMKLSENAAFGMVGIEFFYGEYSNGQFVNLPVSPTDGYEYQYDECSFIWMVRSSVNPSSGWASGEEALWIANWRVVQQTGLVFCEEWYSWVHADHPPIQSSDGILGVYTIAQRQKTNITLAVPSPTYTDVVDSSFQVGSAYRTDFLSAMEQNSKLAAVKVECIYLGEFVNGQSTGNPVSPVDGFVYPYSQCAMMTCMRWNTAGGSYTQPGNNSFLNNFSSSVTGGAVSVTVQTWDPGNGVLTVSGAGRVAVFALCSRQVMPTLYTTENVNAKPNGGNYWTSTPSWYEYSSVLLAGVDQVTFANGSGDNATSITIQWYAGTPYTVALGSPQVIPIVAGVSAPVVPPTGWGGFNFTSVTGTMTNGVLTLFKPSPLAYTSLANQFKEVNPTNLLPGSTLPFTTMKQINDNIRESVVAVEVFGPTNYTNGQTVAIPTSLVDGYVYQRSELFYIATWAAFAATTEVRIIVGEGFVNLSSGLVTCTLFEMASGGSGVSEPDGILSVTTVGIRSGTGRTTGATTTTINQGYEGNDSGS